MNGETRQKQRLSLLRLMRMGFGVVLILMLVIGAANFLVSKTLLLNNSLLIQSELEKAALVSLEKQLLEMETGQRGFMLTFKEDFLASYRQRSKEISETLARLRGSMSDDPDQLDRLKVVEGFVSQKIEDMEKTIALKRDGQEQELSAHLISGKGKRIMDDIRAQISDMLAAEEKLLNMREESLEQAQRISSYVTVGGTLLAAMVSFIVLYFVARRVIQPINQVASNLAYSSNEIAAAAAQQERITGQQSAAVSQTSATMSELKESSRMSADQSEATVEIAKNSARLTEEGREVILQVVDSVNILRDKMPVVAAQMMRLGEQSIQIGNIAELVKDLADQINMLALNASVEAARAGEHGKGFAVVAGEVRKLADQSRRSAQETNFITEDVQKATKSAGIVVEESARTVGHVAAFAERVDKLFAVLSDEANKVYENCQQVSLSARQQMTGINQVSEAMKSASGGLNESLQGMARTRGGIEKLRETTLKLQEYGVTIQETNSKVNSV